MADQIQRGSTHQRGMSLRSPEQAAVVIAVVIALWLSIIGLLFASGAVSFTCFPVGVR